MISFSCPECDKKFRADEAKAGARTTCSGCGSRITIPEAPSAVTTKASAPKSSAMREGKERPRTGGRNERGKPAKGKRAAESSGAVLWIALGGGGVAACAIAVVLFLVLRPKKEEPVKLAPAPAPVAVVTPPVVEPKPDPEPDPKPTVPTTPEGPLTRPTSSAPHAVWSAW